MSRSEDVNEHPVEVKRYRWSDADYNGINSYLLNFDWSQLFSCNLTVDSMCCAFCDVILHAIDMFVPALSIGPSKNKKRYPKNCRKAFTGKRCLWRKHRLDSANIPLLQKYKEAERHCHQLLRELEMKKEKRVVDNNNFGTFYKHINNRLSCRTGVGALRSDDGTVTTTDTSKAELLNDYFSSTCTRDNGVLPAFDKLVPDNVEFSSVTITPDK